MGDKLYENAIRAIRELYGDTSVSRDETVRSLTAIMDEIRMMLDTLDD